MTSITMMIVDPALSHEAALEYESLSRQLDELTTRIVSTNAKHGRILAMSGSGVASTVASARTYDASNALLQVVQQIKSRAK